MLQLESFSSSDQGHLELKIYAELHVYDCNVGNAEDICKLHDYAAHALLEHNAADRESTAGKREAAEAAKLPPEKEQLAMVGARSSTINQEKK